MLTLERSVKTYLVIGLVQGLLLWLSTAIGEPGVRYGLMTAVLVGGINLLLLGDNVRQRGTAWLVVGLTVVMAAIMAAVAGIMVALSVDELMPLAKEIDPNNNPSYGVLCGMSVMGFSLVLLQTAGIG